MERQHRACKKTQRQTLSPAGPKIEILAAINSCRSRAETAYDSLKFVKRNTVFCNFLSFQGPVGDTLNTGIPANCAHSEAVKSANVSSNF
jgi:hypothetical protein